MVGFSFDPARQPCALGHLTSGGTIANTEGLWLARAVRLYPLAARDACARLRLWPVAHLEGADDFELMNWSTAQTLALADALAAHERAADLLREVHAGRVETVGLARFSATHPLVADLVVLAPATAHYSWEKAMKLLGLGADALVAVPTTQARMNTEALARILEARAAKRLPVLAVVGVYGTTEFGTLDPLHEVAALQGNPLQFWLHVDAAWGGYIPSLFRDEGGGLRSRAEVKLEFRHFPSERVYQSTAALSLADSITVDPHKLGFVPFGVGAFLARDRRVFDLVQQDAPYVFVSGPVDGEARYRKLGRFSLEGSRPGAGAAACYVNHQVLPLDAAHFGRLIARSVQTCETLFDRLKVFTKELAPKVRVCVPFEPDCNLVCLAFNPKGNTSLAAANAYARGVYDAMSVRADVPVQVRRFFGSCTTVALKQLAAAELAGLGAELELDLSNADDTGLFLLRHTLMNPWLLSAQGEGEPTYVEAYVHYLTELLG